MLLTAGRGLSRPTELARFGKPFSVPGRYKMVGRRVLQTASRVTAHRHFANVEIAGTRALDLPCERHSWTNPAL